MKNTAASLLSMRVVPMPCVSHVTVDEVLRSWPSGGANRLMELRFENAPVLWSSAGSLALVPRAEVISTSGNGSQRSLRASRWWKPGARLALAVMAVLLVAGLVGTVLATSYYLGQRIQQLQQSQFREYPGKATAP